MPKFDVCVMNPPYCRNLHLDILEYVVPKCAQTLSVNPMQWFTDTYARYNQNSELNKRMKTLVPHMREIANVKTNCEVAAYISFLKQLA